MNRFIYSSLFYLATPLLLIRLILRSFRSTAYLKRWSERFAYYSSRHDLKKVSLVFHAVSVGEVHACVPLINKLLDSDSGLHILVTTSTPTGSARVTELFSDRVTHVYLPYDYPGAMKRFLDCFDPNLLVIMETELWPNLIHYCSQRRVKLILANARLSEKSFHQYQRIKTLTKKMLQQLDAVTVQSDLDSKRLQALGLAESKVSLAGSMKFDMTINAAQIEQSRKDKVRLGKRPVFIAASTRTGGGQIEDEVVFDAYKRLLESHSDLLLILVPRHPERFNEVYELSVKLGFQTARRSRKENVSSTHQVLLGDTMGDMQYYYGLADVAFVGGSLVPTGCQNIIEPAALALPVVTGPSLYNFQAASDQLLKAQGMCTVLNAVELSTVVRELLDNREKRISMGNAAQASVAASQGATEKNLVLISELLSTAR